VRRLMQGLRGLLSRGTLHAGTKEGRWLFFAHTLEEKAPMFTTSTSISYTKTQLFMAR